MRADLDRHVRAMAVREAECALLTPPFAPTDADAPAVRVDLVGCPVCGAASASRPWPHPFRETGADLPSLALPSLPLPSLSMLACESLTARAVLPIAAAVQRLPELRAASFATRAVTWLGLTGLPPADALARVDAAERWALGEDPAAPPGPPVPRTLPASTRPHRPEAGWERHRASLRPRFLTPHPTLPSALEERYEAERRSALLRRYRGTT